MLWWGLLINEVAVIFFFVVVTSDLVKLFMIYCAESEEKSF